MNMLPKTRKFKVFLHSPDPGPVSYPRIDVPADIAHAFLGVENKKRIVLHFDNGRSFHRALLRNGKGETFIRLGKTMLRDAGKRPGEEVMVSLTEDRSEFGYTFPEELQEVLQQDPGGREAFMALMPGMRRSFLYYISSAKTIDTRIRRSLQLVENLKAGVLSAGKKKGR